MRDVCCEDLEVSDDGIRLARNKVAKETAVVRTETKQGLLD